MLANSDQHHGSRNVEPGTLELIKVAGVYFIAPSYNLPNYRGVAGTDAYQFVPFAQTAKPTHTKKEQQFTVYCDYI